MFVPLRGTYRRVWGVLKGKKYALVTDPGDNSDFEGVIDSGTCVVQDWIIITSGICPYWN